jgi:WD40 repeat protein
MGRVLLVHDEHLGRQIALKEMLPPSGSPDNGKTPGNLTAPMLARFLQEARITGQLEHPSIVPVYELGQRADGSLYYTMKLVRGKTMSQAIADAGSLEERLKLLPHFIDLCNAIAYAHSRKVIHRDIKPGNVMVGEFGETVALDWGLAKSKDTDDVNAYGLAASLEAIRLGDEASLEKTTHGQAIGTPTYMPPEQALGQLDCVDERSDVYALGAVLYELLSAHPPYSGKTSKEILAKVVAEAPEDLSRVSTRIPSELIAVCKKAMARAPQDRYQSAKELAEEVQQFQSGGLVGAHTYRISDLARWVMRRYKPVIVTGAVATAALLALGVYAYASNRAAKIVEHELRVESEERLYNVSISLAQRHVDEAKLNVARALLDQCPAELRNWEWGRLRHICDGTSIALRRDASGLCDASFSPDGRELLTISSDGTVVLWDVAQAKELMRVDAGPHGLPVVASSPHGDAFATSSDSPVVKIWDAASGVLRRTLVGHTGQVRSVCYSSDGNSLISGSDDGSVRIWDVDSGASTHVLELGNTEVQCVAIDVDGSRGAAACNDGRVVVFDPGTGNQIREIEAHPTNLHAGVSGVISVAFRPGRAQLASCGCDDTAKLWDLDTGELLHTMRGHVQKVWSVAFDPDGATLVTTSSDRKVKRWDPDTGTELASAIGLNYAVLRAIFSPDGTQLATTGDRNTTRVWDMSEPFGAHCLIGHTADVNAVAFSPDNRFLASGAGHWAVGGDSRVILWDRDSRDSVHILDEHSGPVYCVAFHPDGQWVTSSGADHRIITWDIATGAVVREISADIHSNGVCSIAYSPDGERLLSGGWDDTGDDVPAKAVIWDMAAGTPIHILDGHGHVIDSVDWNAGGTLVATACRDGTTRVWNAATGVLKTSLVADEGWSFAVAFHPRENDLLATGYERGSIRIWNASTGQLVRKLDGDTLRVNRVTFSPDGSRLVSCNNADVNVWNASSGDLLLTVPYQSHSVAFSHDALTLATAGMDGTVILWPALPWK